MGLGASTATALAGLLAVLESAGVPASLNVGQVQPPGAWVTPRTITPERLDGGGQLRTYVYLIVSDTDAAQAVINLGQLLDKALTVIDPDEAVSTAEAVALPDSPPLPAYRLTVDLPVEA